MRVREIEVKGWRCFGDDGVRIPLAPRITVLFGPNSAGKSSVLQLLLATAQSWEEEDGIAQLWTQGELVDAGRFANAVHGQDDEGVVVLGVVDEVGTRRTFSWYGQGRGASYGALDDVVVERQVGDESIVLNWVAHESSLEGERERYLSLQPAAVAALAPVREAAARREAGGQQGGETAETVLADLAGGGASLVGEVSLQPGGWEGRFVDRPTLRELGESDEEFDHRRASIELKNRAVRSELDLMERRGVPLEIQLADEWRLGVLPVRRLVRNLRHIGQTRARGERIYVERRLRWERPYVGSDGSDLAQMLLTHPTGIQSELNSLLQAMHDLPLRWSGAPWSPNYSIQLEQHESPTGAILELTVEGSGHRVALADVGSGYSQVLPILAQLASELKEPDPGLLWIEQPELHLHARLQAGLAEVLARGAEILHGEDEDPGVLRGVQIVCETHSELFIVMLMKLVEEGLLAPEDVLFVGLDVDEDGKRTVEAIPLDDSGAPTRPWPGGFFAERMLLDYAVLRGE